VKFWKESKREREREVGKLVVVVMMMGVVISGPVLIFFVLCLLACLRVTLNGRSCALLTKRAKNNKNKLDF